VVIAQPDHLLLENLAVRPSRQGGGLAYYPRHGYDETHRENRSSAAAASFAKSWPVGSDDTHVIPLPETVVQCQLPRGTLTSNGHDPAPTAVTASIACARHAAR
jgi:hypothetical protein